MKVGQAAAVFLPDITDFSQGLGCVEPSGRLVNTHGVKHLNGREFIRCIRIPANDTGAIPGYAHYASVFPVCDLVSER